MVKKFRQKCTRQKMKKCTDRNLPGHHFSKSSQVSHTFFEVLSSCKLITEITFQARSLMPLKTLERIADKPLQEEKSARKSFPKHAITRAPLIHLDQLENKIEKFCAIDPRGHCYLPGNSKHVGGIATPELQIF